MLFLFVVLKVKLLMLIVIFKNLSRLNDNSIFIINFSPVFLTFQYFGKLKRNYFIIKAIIQIYIHFL